MSDLITRARALAEAASPRPWRWGNRYGDFESRHLLDATDEIVADDGSACGEYSQAIDPAGPDAAFIAAARELVPELCDALERAERERDEANAKNAQASKWLVEARKEADAIRAKLAAAEKRPCHHLEGTPDGTQVVYLHDGEVIILGTPPDDEAEGQEPAHDCDAMGCGSIGGHVTRRIDLAALDTAIKERDEARGRLERATAALELAILWAKGGRDVIADSGDADEEDIAEATRAIADCEAALDAARREP